MADLPRTLSQKTATALPLANGWTEGKGGKHVVKMEKAGCRPITLPAHRRRDYLPGLAAAKLRQAGLKGPET